MIKFLKETKEMLSNPVIICFLVFVFGMTYITTKRYEKEVEHDSNNYSHLYSQVN